MVEKILDSIYEVYMADDDNEFTKETRKRIDWICDKITGDSVLDVGCSQGITSLLLGRKGKEVLGLDIEPKSIRFAENILFHEDDCVKQKVYFEVGDYLTYTFSRKFDSVIMTEILEHVNDIFPFIEKTKNLLVKNGELIVTVPFGVNDFWDHKDTYYVAKMYQALSKYFSVVNVEFFKKWVGFVCNENLNIKNTIKIDLSFLEKEERIFYQIERELVDRNNNLLAEIQKLNQKYRKATADYQTAKQWVIEKKVLNEDLKRILEELQEENKIIKERQKVLSERISEINCSYQNNDISTSAECDVEKLEAIKKKLQHLELENKNVKNELLKQASENKQYKTDREFAEKRYAVLANSKLGSLTLSYWKLKNKIRFYFRKSKILSVSQFLNSKRTKYNNKTKIEKIPLTHTIIEDEKMLPSISVIIPTYTENEYIGEAIESVLNQDYPKEKLQIIISVNGNAKEYFMKLSKRFNKEDRIKVVYTSKKGAAAGRNHALAYVEGDAITFLDDDDYFDKSYLKSMAKHLTGSVTIVFAPFLDFNMESNSFGQENYINTILKKNGNGIVDDYNNIAGLLSTICGKLYRRDQFLQFEKLDESVNNTEDVIFWAQNVEKLFGNFYVCSDITGNSYVRRVVANSLSRPNEESYFNFYIVDRLVVIEKLSNALLSAKTIKAKYFIQNKIKTQTGFIVKAIPKCAKAEAEKALQLIQKNRSIFLNKSQFSTRNGIAFCHNFSPTADPSAYVATKRLNQISDREGLLNWTVFRGDMSNCRKTDLQFENFYGIYQYTKCITIGGKASFNEKAQYIWGRKAYECAEDMDIKNVKVIYSRSMWAGSHVAAAFYKERHPCVIWYAEFSDPVYMKIGNEPRESSRKFTGADEKLNNFWLDVERVVYENADYIIFTNENQKEYMLSYYPDKKVCSNVREKSLVMCHPTIQHEYCELFYANLKLDNNHINIAYFGSFYVNRRANDLWSLLENKEVIIHLFISDSGNLKDIGMLPERAIIHDTLDYFEFLNAASRMDYLVLMDTEFEIPELNPYLPSKLSDYLATGTPIIAFINEGSPLSKNDSEKIIKVKSGSKLDITLNKREK